MAYTLESKLEVLRRAPLRRIAREFGVLEQSIRNWVNAQAEGTLGSVETGKPITPEQMEISRLHAENARLKMEMEIVRDSDRQLSREHASELNYLSQLIL